MSLLALGIDIAVGLAGAIAGRRVYGQAIGKAINVLTKGKPISEGTGGLLGEAIGYGTFMRAKDIVQGKDDKTITEYITEGLAGGVLASAGLTGLKYSTKAISKVLPSEIKQASGRMVKNTISKFFTSIDKETRDTIANHFRDAFTISQAGDIYKNYIRQVLNSPDFTNLEKELITELTSKTEKGELLSQILKVWKGIPDAENPFKLMVLEYGLLKRPDLPVFKEFMEKIKQAPFYDLKRSAFIENRKYIISQLLPKELKKQGFSDDEIRILTSQLLQSLDNLPDNIVIGYIPRFSLVMPLFKSAGRELDYSDIVKLNLDELIDVYAIQKGALKTREFNTLYDKFVAYLTQSNSLDDLLAIQFRRGSDIYKSYLAGYTLPVMFREMPKLLESLTKLNMAIKNKEVLAQGFSRQVWKWYDDTYHLKQEVDEVLTNLMDRLSGIIPVELVNNPLLKFNSFLKHLTLSFSLFHAFTLTKSRLVLNTEQTADDFASIIQRTVYGLARKNVDTDAFIKDLDYVVRGIHELSQKTGQAIEWTLGDTRAFERWYAYFQKPFRDWVLSKYSDKIDHELVRMVNKGLKGISKVFGTLDVFMWDIVYKTFKVSTAKDVLEKWYKGLITDDEAVKALRSINDVFGGAFDWYFVSPQKEQIIRFLLFAPDWYLSLWRNMTTWLKGDNYLIASFYPSLARMHMVLTMASYNNLGLDFMEHVKQLISYSTDTLSKIYEDDETFFDYVASTLALNNLAKLPPHLLWLTYESFSLRVPVVNQAGQMKIFNFHPVKIEFEPLEMIGLIGLAKSIEKDPSIINIIQGAGGQTLQYWSGKLSSFLRLISDLARVGFQKDTELSDYLEKLGEQFFPLTLAYLPLDTPITGRYSKRYASTPELKSLLDMAFLTRNFAIGSKIERQLAESLMPYIWAKGQNPEIERLLDMYSELWRAKKGYVYERLYRGMKEYYKFDDSIARQIAVALDKAYKFTEEGLDKEEREKRMRQALDHLMDVDLGRWNAIKYDVYKSMLRLIKEVELKEVDTKFVEEF